VWTEPAYINKAPRLLEIRSRAIVKLHNSVAFHLWLNPN
jgi:hypothetical protein